MDRMNFFKKSLQAGVFSCTLPILNKFDLKATNLVDDDLEKIRKEKEFIINWLNDLIDTMDKVLDEESKIKIMEGCGRGCYNRFKFKQDIAAKGKGSLNKLIEAYNENFEIWKEEEKIHIRYGEVSKGCYCPAAKSIHIKPNDLHCECTRTTHQTIFETALEKPVKVDILETVRRGGKTCHFVVTV